MIFYIILLPWTSFRAIIHFLCHALLTILKMEFHYDKKKTYFS